MSDDRFLQRRLVYTADGSHSLLLPAFNEQFHSRHGAVQESLHVFIRAGWDMIQQNLNHIAILEVGFGTGLNTWLTLQANSNKNVLYTAIEAYPITIKEADQLNYTKQSDTQGKHDEFMALHLANWNELTNLTSNFKLLKLQVQLEEYATEPNQFDLIYFDAFAPKVQPGLWTVDCFQKLYAYTKPGGILVTYCAKGEVRRNLQAVGYTVERLPGPPGKREMLRARKVI